MPSRRDLLAGLVAMALLGGSAIGLLALRERLQPTAESTDEDVLAVTSGPAVRALSVGYATLAADLYWIRAIQYYGGGRLQLASATAAGRREGYPSLYPLLDLTTTLDPHFNIAYRFGAIFLAEPYPGGAGRPDLAIALLEKGLRARPDKWEYMQDIGFVHYWWRHDYRAAAGWFDRASQVAGAPWFLKSLAAVTLAEGGDRRSSRLMWESIRQSAELDWLRGEADRRLAQLQAFDEIEALQRVVDAVGGPSAGAGGWDALVQARVLRRVPNDPSGTPYEIDAAGRVGLSRSSRLFPLPEEPRRVGGPVS